MNASRFKAFLVLTTLVGFAYLAYDYAVSRIDPLLPLSGTISIDGKPMSKGIVRFISVDPNIPTSFGSYIKDGRYEVPAEFGVTPARYQVEFSSITATDIQDMLAVGGDVNEVKEEVPARFNFNSEIEVDLSAGNVLRADFDLK